MNSSLWMMNATRIEKWSFAYGGKTLTLKNGVLDIENENIVTDSNFVGWYFHTKLKSVTLTATSVTLGVSAFYGCTGLTTVSIPNATSVALNDSAFYGCTGLTTVSIPNVVVSLSGLGASRLVSAFKNCTNLVSATFPGLTGIALIGKSQRVASEIFSGCTALETVSFPDLASVSSRYTSCSIFLNAFANCPSLQAVHFKSSLSGNTYLTASNLGCSEDKILFDL